MRRSPAFLCVLALALIASAAVGNVARASTSLSYTSGGRISGGVAAQSNMYYVCDDYGDTTECLNPHNGQFFNGNKIDVSQYNYRIDPAIAGYVSSSNTWPFDSGSGCNSRYNGDPVYSYPWNANMSYFVRDYTGSDNQVEISNDTSGKYALWVQSGYWLISVAATNSANSNCNTGNPMILTYRSSTGTVWSRCGSCWPAADQNWLFS